MIILSVRSHADAPFGLPAGHGGPKATSRLPYRTRRSTGPRSTTPQQHGDGRCASRSSQRQHRVVPAGPSSRLLDALAVDVESANSGRLPSVTRSTSPARMCSKSTSCWSTAARSGNRTSCRQGQPGWCSCTAVSTTRSSRASPPTRRCCRWLKRSSDCFRRPGNPGQRRECFFLATGLVCNRASPPRHARRPRKNGQMFHTYPHSSRLRGETGPCGRGQALPVGREPCPVPGSARCCWRSPPCFPAAATGNRRPFRSVGRLEARNLTHFLCARGRSAVRPSLGYSCRYPAAALHNGAVTPRTGTGHLNAPLALHFFHPRPRVRPQTLSRACRGACRSCG